jgi:transcriptional regulator with XRE-family HTH domain
MRRRRVALARARRAAGHTQESLAEQLALDRSTVVRWERAETEPSPWIRSRLAAALGLTPAVLDELLGEPTAPASAGSAAPAEDVALTPNSTAIHRSQQEWLRIRQAPGVRGRELTELAAWLYPASTRAPGGHVLAGPGWLLDEPVELDRVRLAWNPDASPPAASRSQDHVLPLTDQGQRYADYSRAVRDLVRPRLLENRPSYRLLAIEAAEPALTFGLTTFFEVFDTKQAIAHEFKAAWLDAGRALPEWTALPLRAALDNPFDPARLLMSPGISTLTIRHDPAGGHRFVLHERNAEKVADGGGLCHVMPAGEFQPSSHRPADVHNDFSLWRNIMREFSEEFLGNPEHDGTHHRPIDYAGDEPFRSLTAARSAGQLRLWHYGLVMEPLELGATQLTVAVIDAPAFDTLFAAMVTINDEGHLVTNRGAGIPFTDDAINRLEPRLSASALTLLRLARRDRHRLIR